jgi:exopolysaccharide production protein ExoQ
MSTPTIRFARSTKATSTFDKCLIIPLLVFAFCLIMSPMLMFEFPSKFITDSRLENQIFWPIITAIALGHFALQKPSRLTWPPHFVWFAAYLALAGASVFWAFKPDISFSRYITQLMLLISIIPPAMIANRRADMMGGVFFCFFFGSIVNALLILGGYSTESLADNLKIGYPGYFPFKGMLGEFAAFAILLSVYEVLYCARRRGLGLITFIIGIYLINVSESKGSLGFVGVAAILAIFILYISKKARISPAIALLPLVILYFALSRTDLMNRLSWRLYGNYDFSGRTLIWDFANFEIAKRPLLGWGYRSIWLVGPDSPAVVDARGFVKGMPSAHNGYLDTMLDTGHIGLALFLVFVFTTVHAIGRVADRDPPRAWLLLSIALFIILVNFLETAWMRGTDALWLMFVVVAIEAGRYWQPFHRGLKAAGPVPRKPVIVGRRAVLARAGGADRLTQPMNNCT